MYIHVKVSEFQHDQDTVRCITNIFVSLSDKVTDDWHVANRKNTVCDWKFAPLVRKALGDWE